MTVFAVAAPYIGTAARLFSSFYSSASGPFAGLLILAISSPWVNAKGAAWGTLLVCVLQLWHAIGRSVSPIALPPAFTGTLDRCSNESSSNSSIFHPLLHDREYVLPLYEVSFYVMSFVGALLTLFLGTVLSLATGGATTIQQNLHLTSPLFLKMWRNFTFFRRKVELQERVAKKSTNRLGQQCDDECTTLRPELSPMFGAHRLHDESSV
ncbi:hypothetical protein MTO96_045991 [Rhipicephalus appendiculatus]